MNLKNFRVNELFTPKTGDYHATKELEPGGVPLISCGDANNGLTGYYDIPEENQYSHTITVAYNGTYAYTGKFHPYSFGAKDDVAVLIPQIDLDDKTLIYIAATFNRERWRYSYSRKCFKEKLKTVEIPLPATDGGEIDEERIKEILSPVEATLPRKSATDEVSIEPTRWEKHDITEYFEIDRGDFHSLSRLEPGEMPTVSRVTENNGVVGYYEPPGDAKIYEPYKITVSTTSGKAFVQTQPFISTDNVVILTPKWKIGLATAMFFQLMINHESWRYSYGRQCYKTKFSETKIFVPLNEEGNLDKQYMEAVVENTSYWDYLESQVGKQRTAKHTAGD